MVTKSTHRKELGSTDRNLNGSKEKTTPKEKDAQDAPSQQRDSAAEPKASCGASEQPEQTARGKRKGSEVDELFGKLKKASKSQAAKAPGKKPAVGSKDDLFGSGPGKARRKDADGFTIYTEDELKVGKGGKTPLCPFDCECCF